MEISPSGEGADGEDDVPENDCPQDRSSRSRQASRNGVRPPSGGEGGLPPRRPSAFSCSLRSHSPLSPPPIAIATTVQCTRLFHSFSHLVRGKIRRGSSVLGVHLCMAIQRTLRLRKCEQKRDTSTSGEGSDVEFEYHHTAVQCKYENAEGSRTPRQQNFKMPPFILRRQM